MMKKKIALTVILFLAAYVLQAQELQVLYEECRKSGFIHMNNPHENDTDTRIRKDIKDRDLQGNEIRITTMMALYHYRGRSVYERFHPAINEVFTYMPEKNAYDHSYTTHKNLIMIVRRYNTVQKLLMTKELL